MNNDTIRRLYTIGIILAVVLFLAMVWDHFANDQDLLTPLFAVFAVVDLILIILLFLRAASKTAPEPEPTEEGDRLDYPGDVHQAVDLEGVGPVYAARLTEAGILNTQQLLFTPTKELARITKAPAKTVELWKSMSQLVKVRGVGPQYAEALARSGIGGIEELQERDANAMAVAITTYLDSLNVTVIGQKVTAKRVQGWKDAAKGMKKVPIKMDGLKIMPLESKAAIAGAAASS